MAPCVAESSGCVNFPVLKAFVAKISEVKAELHRRISEVQAMFRERISNLKAKFCERILAPVTGSCPIVTLLNKAMEKHWLCTVASRS